MNKLYALLLSSLFFITSQVHGAGIPTNIQQQLYNVEISSHGTFRQENTLKGIPFPIKSSGEYSFSSGELTWKNLKPVESTLILTKNRVEQFVSGEEHFSVSAQQQPILRTINQLFLSLFDKDWQALSESFNLQITQKDNCWKIHMTPKQDILKAAITSAYVYGDLKIRRFELTKNNGDQTSIWFSDEDK